MMVAIDSARYIAFGSWRDGLARSMKAAWRTDRYFCGGAEAGLSVNGSPLAGPAGDA